MKALKKQVNIRMDCGNLETAPDLHIKLGDVEIKLPPKAYVMEVTLPQGTTVASNTEAEAVGLAWRSEGSPPAGLSRADLWRKLFHDLFIEKGIDLRSHVENVSDLDLQEARSICMPAFTELDANTEHGKLWILGTPLFEKYYTRFQWHSDRDTPQVYLKDKSEASACKKQDNAESPSGGTSLLSEAQTEVKAVTSSSQASRRVSFDDIRYPHWAQKVTQL
jgi:hypothetical protein